MTKRDINNKTLERGGLMLEALAMLGLIAVVTPTMYKKSAERMLEIEDINTASTVRTYSKAAETYMAENLATIIADMEESGSSVMTIQPSDLTAYLPYKFDVTQNLYDYNTPNIRIYKAGDNLTAFIQFPAKADAAGGIGQERTARIASLIGSNGGYMTSGNTARGVGGVWSLDATTYGDIFGTNANTYSLMTASANIINGSAEAGLENSKYLQRTFEGENEEWRNTMRTDLYMGGYNANDDYPTDHPDTDTRHSIRNINSLIVGAENPAAGADAAGLYIADASAGNSKPNAFIAGTLTAASSQLFADNTKLQYGVPVTEGNPYNFEVTQTGDVSNIGNLDLAKNFNANNANYVRIGGTSADSNNVLFATHDASDGSINLNLINSDEFLLNSKAYTAADGSAYTGLLSLMNNGYKKVSTLANDGTTVSYAMTPAFGSGYIDRNNFQVNIGANTKVDGLLAARQIDAQKLRLATLSAGSDNIDDAEKWLNVDGNGVVIKTPMQKRLTNPDTDVTRAVFNASGATIQYRGNVVDNTDPTTSGGYVTMTGDASNVTTDVGGKHVILSSGENISLRTPGIRTEQTNNELVIGPGNYEDVISFGTNAHRTTFHGGHVDLWSANLQVLDESARSVLSVMGNSSENSGFATDWLNKQDPMVKHGDYSNADAAVNMAVHGNTVFTSTLGGTTAEPKSVHYLTLGKNDTDAAVNIIRGSGETETKASNKRLLVVDTTQKPGTSGGANQAYVQNGGLTADESSDEPTSYAMDAGTIYIRKGLLDVSADKNPASGRASSAASTGNGIIRASRLVANNMDSGGNVIKVPQIFKNGVYSEYNGDTTRYDTYMVNPAYTSVMNDIKLVSRAGARLSDILPDFIIKGIYLVNNDYDDTMSKLEFQASNAREIVGAPGKNSSEPWASPYSGVAPAPQCPPGYMRVITVNPTGLRMADAGQIARTKLGNGQYGIYANEYKNAQRLNNITTAVQADSTKVADYTPDYAYLEADSTSSGATMTLTTFDGVSTSETKTYDVDAVHHLPVIARKSAASSNTMEYVLAVENQNALVPMTIQQSTWFKALYVPLVDSTARSWQKTYGNDGYQRGWAILLGFVYPSDIYQDFASALGVTTSHELAGGYYWNLFPVMKTSLEAFATTYCYFDRHNETTDYKAGYGDYIHDYDAANYIPSSYEKSITVDYDRNLNDPNMKYNERW
ncbi:MAG: hypothetical protein J6Y91_04370 [Alphaproteobacteria bacterium]|nr:hypothetical protein [Alphaproteobacteria bacterium]